MKSSHHLVLAPVLICFWFSGMAGLVYQIVWARYLALFLGHTSYAVVAVLVAFMGGLALGNASLGSRADRSRRPLRLYAWLEIGIGFYALAFPAYYSSFVALARHLAPGGSAVLMLKFAFSFLTILLPTVMMGATFPVLARFVTRSLEELRQRVAALYAINSAGAVAGCLVADFWWIPAYGLQATVFTGAALNLAVGTVAWGLSRWIQEGKPLTPSAGEREDRPPSQGEPVTGGSTAMRGFTGDKQSLFPLPCRGGEGQGEGEAALASDAPTLTAGEIKLAILGIALSGFVAMLYEVAWTRMLLLAQGHS